MPTGGPRISAVEVATGRTRILVDCPDDICAASVSPDLATVASADGDGVWLQTVGSGEKRAVPRSDVGATGAPTWSPDGHSLAFVGAEGLYVADLAASTVELVRGISHRPVGPVAWSLDGTRIAYFDTLPVPQSDGETQFIAEVLDLSTGKTTPLLNAGSCTCLGIAAPTLAWSPDGRTIVVATTRGGEKPWGVYLVDPDGAELEQVVSGSYAALAWQPLRD